MDCSVCCEKLNKSTRKLISCVFCEFVVCRQCFQKYTEESTMDAHCMSCKKTFTFEFIESNCTSVFIDKNYKVHRQGILFDREKALLPETQPYVVIEHQRRDIRAVVGGLYDQKYELLRQVKLLEIRINDLNRQANILTVGDNTGEDRRKFVRKCPMTECRGFLSTQWKCGSCESKICNKCNEEKVEDHVCNPDNVASMELLNKDTKGCPNCGTMIFKISGCSQMYCTDCHTAWDWNTSRVVTGTIHNPHYYEFMNRGGHANRNLADIPCGGLPDIASINRLFIKLRLPSELVDHDRWVITHLHQVIVHIEHYELRNYVLEEYNPDTYRGLRIKYLMNDLGETEFKTELHQREKRRQKTTAFNNILQMFVNVGTDLMGQIVVEVKTVDHLPKFVEILKNLVVYFNENLQKIGKIYKCVYPGISDNYTFVNNLETANRRLKQN